MADINVLMMGGRRAGKTSVLAAMDECTNDALADIRGLYVSCQEGGEKIQNKKTELEFYFTERYMRNMTFTADLNPDDTAQTYTYEVTVNDRDSGYTLNFMDFPGEWFSNPEKQEELQEKVNMSQVIMITIDTPHMVEAIEEATGVGKYHYEFNRVPEITHFFKNAFQNSKQERMVLFVPLKCEKYYYKNQMNLVNETLKAGYSELLSFLQNDELKGLCTVGIVPILTIGGAEFFKFNDNGYAGIYSYVKDPAMRKYSPRYCEQPLFLTLYYLIKMAETSKANKGSFARWLSEIFLNSAKLDDLVSCKKKLERLIQTDKNAGFEIFQNPLGMEMK